VQCVCVCVCVCVPHSIRRRRRLSQSDGRLSSTQSTEDENAESAVNDVGGDADVEFDARNGELENDATDGSDDDDDNGEHGG